MGGVLMKRIFGFLTVAAFVGMLFAANVFAQSSGSFEYSNAGGLTACVLNSSNGQITGGQRCGTLTSGAACTTSSSCSTGLTCQNATACTAGIVGGPCGTGVTCDVS